MTINENEGFGRFDGIKKGTKLQNLPVCRFHYPKFPMDETKLIVGLSKDITDNVILKYKADLKKITKYLIRQTNDDARWDSLKRLDFYQFLYDVGMFKTRHPR